MKCVVVLLMLFSGCFAVHAGGIPVISEEGLWAEKVLFDAQIKHVAVTDLYFPCSIRYQFEVVRNGSVWLDEKYYFVPEHKLHCDGRKHYEKKVLDNFIDEAE